MANQKSIITGKNATHKKEGGGQTLYYYHDKINDFWYVGDYFAGPFKAMGGKPTEVKEC